MAHLSLDGEPLIKPSIGKLLGSSSDKKLSRSTVFAAVYPDSEETTSEEFNGLMVNEYQILYSPHHNPHYNLSQIQNRGFNAKSLEEFAYLLHNMLVVLITLPKN